VTIFFLAIFFIGSIANSIAMISMGPEYGTRTEYEAHMHFMYRTLVCLVITAIATLVKIVNQSGRQVTAQITNLRKQNANKMV